MARYDGAIKELEQELVTVDSDLSLMEDTVKSLKGTKRELTATINRLKKMNGDAPEETTEEPQEEPTDEHVVEAKPGKGKTN